MPDFAYAGEVALAVVLADPTGELTARAEQARSYPPALAHALVDGLWEARFIVDGARKAAVRGDSVYVAGCLFRALELCAHALHAYAGRWLINEKGAIAAAGRLPDAPAGFTDQARAVVADLGTAPHDVAATLERADRLIDATTTACHRLF